MQVQEINRFTLQELYADDDAPVQCTGTLGVITISVYMQYVHVIRYSNAQIAHYGSFPAAGGHRGTMLSTHGS